MSSIAGALTTFRTNYAGALRLSDVGSYVRLGGWVHNKRNLGGLIFIDLRDRTGLVQISFDPALVDASALQTAAQVGKESVVLVEGDVVARPPAGRNPDLATGEVEVKARSLRVVGPAETPAIPVGRVKGEPLPAEEQRLRHRYLDLRRPELQQNLILRHRLMQATRHYLSDHGFLEIETPILTKPTPEGARDYLVPSRVHAGEFYALPQSPQLYKQLLMVSGFDRYFQIARCFRDEDLRSDRQPEFTQIDIEASFIGPEDVFAFTEGMLKALWSEGGVEIETPFPRITYTEAMERFGSDRPDMRYALEIFDASDFFRPLDFGITKSALEAGGRVRGIRIPGGAELSRKQVDSLEELARGAGASGLLRLKREAATGELSGPVAKFLEPSDAERLGLEPGDLALFVAAPDHVSNPALDRVRQEAARIRALVPADVSSFLWVTDFPLFERDPDTQALGAVHHPFTSPSPADLPLLDTTPEKARAVAYDVVLNGTELGGGSIRIGDPELQRRIFGLLGIDEETARQRFGFLLEGLRSGAPPHGGIALGMDRIAMLISGAGSLRDVIAFPKTTQASALFEGAPSPVPERELRDLHVRVEGKGEGSNERSSNK
ncbi:MAG TPA: aspartate--tRNA ligase [Gemmatimonadaceae bacterium]|nr:aspartate--tRNA ligase [Gemmatimonadaceae bacterium]